MANVYVYSGAAGAGTGADWTNAYTTLAAACTAKAAGDVFYVAHDHAESNAASYTVTFPGTPATPNRAYCVNRAGSVPPVSADLRTTATISTTLGNNMTLSGTAAEIYGIIFSVGTGANTDLLLVCSASTHSQRYVNCAFRLGTTGGGASTVRLGASASALVILENTTFQFADTANLVAVNSRVIWRNTPNAITGSTFPTSMFVFQAGAGHLFAEGIDFSALGAGNAIFASTSNFPAVPILKDCKLASGVTIMANPTTGPQQVETTLVRCDSGDTNYRTEKYTYTGTQTTETTIVRSGGATDGTTPIAWKIVTTANSEWEFPFECLPISAWNETTGSAITVTIQGIWGGGAVPLNDEIWIDVEYLGTSGFPLASKATSTKADGLATGANIPAGSGTWGGSTTKFAMAVTFTPQEKGPITVYVRAAKVSSTFYVDPKPVVT